MPVNEQLVASIVHIDVSDDVPGTGAVEPKLSNVYYTHDGGRGDEMKPHTLVWEAIGLRPGDVIEIRLLCHGMTSRQKEITEDKALAVLRRGFKGAFEERRAGPAAPAGVFWRIPNNGATCVESGHVDLADDDHDRINLKYSVTLHRGGAQHTLDPDINLIPDP